MSHPDESIVLDRLTRRFREGDRTHVVLEEASGTLRRGEVVAIVGRSGSGKSTLLNLVSGIDSPDAGRVLVHGECVSALREPERTLFRRAHVGFVYQFFNLLPTLDVLGNVQLPLELQGVRGATARERAQAALAAVGLGDRGASPVDALSGGEQQRVAIARALVHEPSVLLADEPTGNLDGETAAAVLPLLLGLARQRRATVVLVTHDADVAALADRILDLREGRLHARAGAVDPPA